MADARKQVDPGSGHKVGVYICHCGGNISDHVDVDAVCAKAETIPGVTVARTNMFMCSDPGQELIMEDLRSGKVDRVVIASCAPSLHEATFRNAMLRAGANPYLYEHANIREQVSWVHHGDAATQKAFRLIAAATAKADQLEPLEPLRVEARRHATVIGAGIAGLKTAWDLAERGIDVALLEQSPFLGGRVAQLDRLSPTGESAEEILTDLASRVLGHPRVTVHNCASVTGFQGYIGNFQLQVTRRPPGSEEDREKLDLAARAGKTPGSFAAFAGVLPTDLPREAQEFTLNTGVIVLATGFKSYQPRTGEYGFGSLPEVVTLPQFLRIMAEEPSHGSRLEVNGKPIRSVALIHCVGSREIPGIHEEGE
ncbi:MAG TPA: disulfide reductase, partial [Syntrophobacteraceae bacterium]|nr:disulfide reductase [Syntrophobacteraceae bacterium]